jgi:hypothetical protein
MPYCARIDDEREERWRKSLITYTWDRQLALATLANVHGVQNPSIAPYLMIMASSHMPAINQ